MELHDMREWLKTVPDLEGLKIEYEATGTQKLTLGDKVLEVGPMASNDEIKAALLNPFLPTRNTSMTITGFQPGMIQEKLNDIKQKAAQRRAASFAKLDAANTKLAGVDTQIEAMADQIDKEADAALHEFAQFTNMPPEGV